MVLVVGHKNFELNFEGFRGSKKESNLSWIECLFSNYLEYLMQEHLRCKGNLGSPKNIWFMILNMGFLSADLLFYRSLLVLVSFLLSSKCSYFFLEVHFRYISFPVKFHCRIKSIFYEIEIFSVLAIGYKNIELTFEGLRGSKKGSNLS